jgi:hypothetical protein
MISLVGKHKNLFSNEYNQCYPQTHGLSAHRRAFSLRTHTDTWTLSTPQGFQPANTAGLSACEQISTWYREGTGGAG